MTLYFYIYIPETNEFHQQTSEAAETPLRYYHPTGDFFPTGYSSVYKSEINSIALFARYPDTYVSDHPAAEEALEALYNNRLEKAAIFRQEANNQTTMANEILDLITEHYR